MGIYYTNQTIESYKEFEKTGVLKGNKRFVWEEFVSPYQWMINQMNKRIGHDDSFPVWLWKEKPDLKEEGHFPKGTKAVCLTVEIPDEDLLASDFAAWHSVLNDWFLALNEEEDEAFEQGESSLTKEQSWERIFDLELLQSTDYWRSEQPHIQFVTGSIHQAQIKEVRFFEAK